MDFLLFPFFFIPVPSILFVCILAIADGGGGDDVGRGGPFGGGRVSGVEREQGPAGGGTGKQQRPRGRVDPGQAGEPSGPDGAAARGPRAQQRPQTAARGVLQDLALEEGPGFAGGGARGAADLGFDGGFG